MGCQLATVRTTAGGVTPAVLPMSCCFTCCCCCCCCLHLMVAPKPALIHTHTRSKQQLAAREGAAAGRMRRNLGLICWIFGWGRLCRCSSTPTQVSLCGCCGHTSYGRWSHHLVLLATLLVLLASSSGSSGSSAQQYLLVPLAYHTVLLWQQTNNHTVLLLPQKNCVINKQYKCSCTKVQAVAFSWVYNHTG